MKDQLKQANDHYFKVMHTQYVLAIIGKNITLIAFTIMTHTTYHDYANWVNWALLIFVLLILICYAKDCKKYRTNMLMACVRFTGKDGE